MRNHRFALTALLGSTFATPLFAQSDAEAAVGGAMGLLIGLLIAIVVGAVVGWIASQIVKGSGSGFWGDVILGIGGSLLAGFVLPLLGIGPFGFFGALVASVIGAIVLILIVRAIRRAS